MKQPAFDGRAATELHCREVDDFTNNLQSSPFIDKFKRAASSDGWLMAQIVRSAPDMAAIIVAYDELAKRHTPFFVRDFELAFYRSLRREVQNVY